APAAIKVRWGQSSWMGMSISAYTAPANLVGGLQMEVPGWKQREEQGSRKKKARRNAGA
ncbi:unnamed protein product, partial [Urochloa humidicola]